MKKNILLVEYNPDSIDKIKEILHQDTLDIKIAGDEATAKKLLKKQEFHLVITEALLPKSHGFTLCKYINENYPEIKIIIISEKLKKVDYQNEALAHGACEYIEKPLDDFRFRETVSKHLKIYKKKGAAYHNETTKINVIPLSVLQKAQEKAKAEEKSEEKPDKENNIEDLIDKDTHPYEIKLD